MKPLSGKNPPPNPDRNPFMIQLAEFDLSTHYLGLPVKSPPLADQPERVRQLERAGAGAITLHSLFEEQIRLDEQATEFFTEAYDDTFGEALTYFPRLEDFNIGPEQYLTKIRNLKEVTDLPIIGSLNGVSFGGWVQYATAIEEAGADALELNFYHIATNPEESGSEVEGRLLEVLMRIRECVHIPIAVKLSPFYSALPHLAVKLTSAGANGLVLFNRFYQPDIDIEMQETLATIKSKKDSTNVFGLIADQTPLPTADIYWSTFMNQETAFFTGTERIAYLTKFPVVFVGIEKLRRGYYQIRFEELAEPPYIKNDHSILDNYIVKSGKDLQSGFGHIADGNLNVLKTSL